MNHGTVQAWAGGMLLAAGLLPACARCEQADTGVVEADADDALEFDTAMLRQRGLDPKLADYFSRGARFTPGRQRVALVVNSQSRGDVTAMFDADGTLCMDASLLEHAGLKLPRSTGPEGSLSCGDFLRAYPSTVVEPDPASRTVSLVVPDEGRLEGKPGATGFQRGGVAAVFNYSVMGTRSDGSSGASTYVAALSEAGFNAGDWIFRSRQNYSSSQGRATWDITQSYAQRTFVQQKMVLQLGELEMINPVLPGASITGVQLLPEAALQVGDGPSISGIAQSTARVEVRQHGVLLYATVVEAGRFTLSQLPRLSAFTEVVVNVIEADGSEHGFTVPAVALAGLVRPQSGYTFAAGRVRNVEVAPGRQPWVASAGWSGPFGRWGTASVALMAAQDYTAVGGSAFMGWTSGTSLSPYGVVSQVRDADGTLAGWHAGVGVQQTLGTRLSLNAAVAVQSRDYRELLDVMSYRAEGGTRARYREQANVALSWATDGFGAFSAGYSRATLFDRRASSRATLSWGRNFRRATVSLNAERDLGQRDVRRGEEDAVQGDAYRVYLSVSVPLGERRRLRTNVQHDRGGERIGVALSDSISNTLNYRVSVDRDSWSGRTDTSATASWLPRYLQVSGAYTHSNIGSSSTSLLASGGLAVHAQGVTLSPYPIQDTFGIVALSDKAAGVEITTPYGPVWTDAWGRAVVAQLSPYMTSLLEVEPESLPRNVTLDNGLVSLEAGRGAVARIDLDTRYNRRLQLLPRRLDGSALPRGTTAFRDTGALAGMITAGGSLFVVDAVSGETLELHLPDQSTCTLTYTLDDKEDETVTIASATVPCEPVPARVLP
jgi:outer membrane usher protein FimD/PapC